MLTTIWVILFWYIYNLICWWYWKKRECGKNRLVIMKQNGKWLLLLQQVIPAHISSYHNRKDVISWGLNKMSDILQTTFWNLHFVKWKVSYFVSDFTDVCSWWSHLLANKSAWVQVMAWCLTGSKPIPDQMKMDLFHMVSLGHNESICNCWCIFSFNEKHKFEKISYEMITVPQSVPYCHQ